MSPPAPGLAEFLDRGGWSSATLLAGRPFHFTYESLFLKLLIAFDLPAMIAMLPLSAILSVFWKTLHFGSYSASYLAAVLLLFAASCQWLVIGKRLERWLTRRRKGNRICQQLNRRFRLVVFVILATTLVLAPIVLERSRRLGFRHAGISFR
jgi:hypothetical protein